MQVRLYMRSVETEQRMVKNNTSIFDSAKYINNLVRNAFITAVIILIVDININNKRNISGNLITGF